MTVHHEHRISYQQLWQISWGSQISQYSNAIHSLIHISFYTHDRTHTPVYKLTHQSKLYNMPCTYISAYIHTYTHKYVCLYMYTVCLLLEYFSYIPFFVKLLRIMWHLWKDQRVSWHKSLKYKITDYHDSLALLHCNSYQIAYHYVILTVMVWALMFILKITMIHQIATNFPIIKFL